MNQFGENSKQQLIGVHSNLVVITTTALMLCYNKGIDFAVVDGLRTKQEQEVNIAAGVSWTMNSKHLKQKDGFGHAVDLVPVINGKLRFDAIKTLVTIGKAMKQASELHKVPIKWGALKKYGGDWTRQNDMYHFELA